MIVTIVGATGTGKSELSLDVAEALAARGHAAEIVNADAMQLYRGMDIGTAKVPFEQRRGIRHHLLDVLAVTEEASVSDFQLAARTAIDDIRSRGVVPILVGGSGLYVSSVLFDFRFPGTDPEIRAALECRLEAEGPGMLHRALKEKDSEAATAIGPHNGRRLVRALEVIEITGEKFGAGLPDEQALWCPATIVGVQSPRDVLVARLERRVELMWAQGLVTEVETLLPRGLATGTTASRAIGYAQAIAQLEGRLTEAEAIKSAATLTRKFARRQVSWFKRYPSPLWLEGGAEGNTSAVVSKFERVRLHS